LSGPKSFAATLHTALRAYCSDGMTVSQMCQELNARGIKSARDGEWQPTQLRRTLDRLELRTRPMHKAPAKKAGEARVEWDDPPTTYTMRNERSIIKIVDALEHYKRRSS
jgi:hypothetical protein